MTFEELIARAAEPTLQALVGRPGVRLLAILDPGLTQPERLRNIALGLKTPQDLLMNPETRRELLVLLPPPEASSLLTCLEIQGDGDPYETLETMRVSRKSARASALLD